MSALRALTLPALLWCLFARAAVAQTTAGEIRVTVVDAAGDVPLGDARATLLGPQNASSLTAKTGTIVYTDVPTGIYRVRVAKAGYDAGTSPEFDVLAGRAGRGARRTIALHERIARDRCGDRDFSRDGHLQ